MISIKYCGVRVSHWLIRHFSSPSKRWRCHRTRLSWFEILNNIACLNAHSDIRGWRAVCMSCISIAYLFLLIFFSLRILSHFGLPPFNDQPAFDWGQKPSPLPAETLCRRVVQPAASPPSVRRMDDAARCHTMHCLTILRLEEKRFLLPHKPRHSATTPCWCTNLPCTHGRFAFTVSYI